MRHCDGTYHLAELRCRKSLDHPLLQFDPVDSVDWKIVGDSLFRRRLWRLLEGVGQTSANALFAFSENLEGTLRSSLAPLGRTGGRIWSHVVRLCHNGSITLYRVEAHGRQAELILKRPSPRDGRRAAL